MGLLTPDFPMRCQCLVQGDCCCLHHDIMCTQQCNAKLLLSLFLFINHLRTIQLVFISFPEKSHFTALMAPQHEQIRPQTYFNYYYFPVSVMAFNMKDSKVNTN